MTTEMCPRASLRSVHSAPYELGVCVCVVTTWIMYQKNLVGTIHASDRSLVNRSRPVYTRPVLYLEKRNQYATKVGRRKLRDVSHASASFSAPDSAQPHVRFLFF